MCTAVEETNMGDPRSYEHYWTSSWNKVWKKKKKKTQCHFVRQIVHATRIVGLLLPGGSS